MDGDGVDWSALSQTAFYQVRRHPQPKSFIIHRPEDTGDDGRQYGVLQENLSNCKPIYSELAKRRKSEGRVQCPPT